MRGSAASTVLEPLLLGPRRPGRLLGASAAAAYVHVEGAGAVDVIALVPPSSVRLPLAMVVGGALPPVGGDVSVGDGALHVGADTWAPARWFDPRPGDVGEPKPSAVAAAVAVLRRLGPGELGLDPERAWRAVAALVAGEAGPAVALLGEGPGLTPAGDDVVAGAVAVCALRGHAAGLRVVPDVLAGARAATTSLSAALLACAAAGQVVPPAATLLAALGGAGEVGGALADLRSVGSTSGTALAVGMVAALT